MSIGTPCPPNVPGWFGWMAVDEEGTGADGRGCATKGHWKVVWTVPLLRSAMSWRMAFAWTRAFSQAEKEALLSRWRWDCSTISTISLWMPLCMILIRRCE